MSGGRIDAAAVRARVSLAGLVGRRVRLRERRAGDFWGCCPFHAEATPSFHVREAAGRYHCFGCGATGDAFDWLRETEGRDFAAALAELAAAVGLGPPADDRPEDPAARAARRKRAAEAAAAAEARDAERAARAAATEDWARRVWRQSVPAAGTPAEAYLRGRGIRLAPPPTLRFNPDLTHPDLGLGCPTMVAAVQQPDGALRGIHRTYLAPGGAGKAAVASAKLMAGTCRGGAVRLAPAAPRLALAKGIETALSVAQATPGLAVWAALSLGNFAAIGLPPIVREVVICADSDGKPSHAADHAAILDRAVRFHAARGRAVRLARPPAGLDFNDWLQAGGGVAA